MKISSLTQDIVSATYEHGGESLTMKIDRNVITPAFFRLVAELRNKPANGNGHKPEDKTEGGEWEEAATELEGASHAGAVLLSSHLIKEWDLTEDDGMTPVPISEETFAKFPPMLISDLFALAMNQAQTVKKTITSTTSDGSPDTLSATSTDDLTT